MARVVGCAPEGERVSFSLLDDGFYCHPKVMRLSAEFPRAFGNAVALWALALSRSGNAGTDLVTRRAAASLVPFERRRLLAACDALVTVGLWNRHGDDFLIHDWEHWSGRRKKRKKPQEQAESTAFAVQNGCENDSVNGCEDEQSEPPEPELLPAPSPEPPAPVETAAETAAVMNTEDTTNAVKPADTVTSPVDFKAALERLADRIESTPAVGISEVISVVKMNTESGKNDAPTRARSEIQINQREERDGVTGPTPPAPARTYEKPPELLDAPAPPKRQDPEAVMVRRTDGTMVPAPSALLAIFSQARSAAGYGKVPSTYSAQTSAQEAARGLLELADYDPSRFLAMTKAACTGFLADPWRSAADEVSETKRYALARGRTGIRSFAEHAADYAQVRPDEPGGVSALRRRVTALDAEINALPHGDPRREQLRREQEQVFDKLRGMRQAAS